ncbi:hypothetical protein [Xenorhabdus hominickii]|uniref:Type III secretion system effector ExoY, adenylate cyclase n=1 Tax=Xenorhabdus hominickii TaxID=351679 RepID=A0A2G0Q1R1_XENHO|nr:hypothetical protein A9255_06945 [Xenorhabdus hominickii]PHM53145.1 type III secretion system effector ExoY, adenylate cyclase [Xenorhabdus hominickii]
MKLEKQLFQDRVNRGIYKRTENNTYTTQDKYHFNFQAIPDEKEDYTIYHNKKPIEVLSSTKTGKPLTADYDLFLIAPKLSLYGNADIIKNPEVTYENYIQQRSHYREKNAKNLLNKEEFNSKEDPNLGNISNRIEKIIEGINQKIALNKPNLVHHSADSGNPTSNIYDNFPALFLLPEKIEEFEIIFVIKNYEEFCYFVQQAKNAHYYVPINPLWPNKLRKLRSDSFTLSKQFFEKQYKKNL